MKYVIISGSHRSPDIAQSLKVSKWIQTQLKNRGEETELISLSGNPFPLWDESYWEGDSELKKQMQSTLDIVASADALVVVTPEWSGMVPGGLKNFFLYLSSKEVGHKPALLVAVSASRGGAYPIAELRASSYKNTKILYIPDHLIIRSVADVMNDAEEAADDKNDGYSRKRALWSLDVLAQYAKAMKSVREANVVWEEGYQNGM